jgi:hypothetical protein
MSHQSQQQFRLRRLRQPQLRRQRLPRAPQTNPQYCYLFQFSHCGSHRRHGRVVNLRSDRTFKHCGAAAQEPRTLDVALANDSNAQFCVQSHGRSIELPGILTNRPLWRRPARPQQSGVDPSGPTAVRFALGKVPVLRLPPNAQAVDGSRFT